MQNARFVRPTLSVRGIHAVRGGISLILGLDGLIRYHGVLFLRLCRCLRLEFDMRSKGWREGVGTVGESRGQEAGR